MPDAHVRHMAPEKKNEGRFRFARGKRAYDSSRFGAPEPAAACVAQNVSAQSGRPSPSVAKPRADESAMRRTWERASILGVFKRCALGGGTDVVCACEHTRRSRSAFPPNKIAAGAGASPKSRSRAISVFQLNRLPNSLHRAILTTWAHTRPL